MENIWSIFLTENKQMFQLKHNFRSDLMKFMASQIQFTFHISRLLCFIQL